MKLKSKTTATILIVVFILSVFAVAMPALAVNVVHVYDGESIQDAIDSASSETVIIVHEGTYLGDLVIDTPLELRAAAEDSVTIEGVDTLVYAGNYPLADPNIDIQADGVKIHGFTIMSPIVADGYYSSGIVLTGENIEIYDNEFVSRGDGLCVVIQTYHHTVTLIMDIDISGLDIYDNVFTSTGTGGYYGVYINPTIEGTGIVTVMYNEFTGNILQGVVTERDDTEITDNLFVTDFTPTVPALHYGIVVREWNAAAQSDVLVSGNALVGSEEGNGFMRGIRIGSAQQVLTNIDVNGNSVTDCGVGIHVRSAGGVTVNHNSIFDNDMGVENTAPETLDATMNWWGTEVESEIQLMVSGDVDYNPWIPLGSVKWTVMTAIVRFPMISISVSDTFIDFGRVVAGGDSDEISVIITNTGEGFIGYSATLFEDTTFYTDHLYIDESLVGDFTGYTLGPGSFDELDLQLRNIPLTTPLATYDGTLVFWAEAIAP